MKKMLIALLTLVFILSGCVQQSSDDTIVILTSSGYPPFEMIDEDGNLIGFDIDFGNELGARLGVQVEWVDMDFDGIIGSLNSNRGTMAIAAMSPDPQRDVDFSIPYYVGSEESPFFILTLANGPITDTNSISGKIAGVQIGTIQEGLLNNVASEFNLVLDPRQNLQLLVAEIITGRIDFVLMEGVTAREFASEFPALTTFEMTHPEVEKYIEEVQGVAVALPRNSEWTARVNAVIQEMKDDGTLATLIAKWFND